MTPGPGIEPGTHCSHHCAVPGSTKISIFVNYYFQVSLSRSTKPSLEDYDDLNSI